MKRVKKQQIEETCYRNRSSTSFIIGCQKNTIHIRIKKEDILEVYSKKNLPLQILDLVLGAICFRLNDKHKLKSEGAKRRGKRTILKEKLYKHIYFRISQIRRGFNVGTSTGFSAPIEIWTMPYRHWSFVPKMVEVDHRRTKKGRK